MDIKTGLSIYNKQWLIEPSAALMMLDYWEKVKAGEATWAYQSAKQENAEDSPYKIYQKFFANDSRIAMAPDSSWDMEDFKGFEGAAVAVIPVAGPIMKNDFCGSFGTTTLKRLTSMADNTASVKTILFLIDSPGGTVDGTNTFSDAIKASKKNTVALVDGMMCSAAYWIGSSCNQIFATSETDVIGSIGTMCSMMDNSEAMKANGYVLRTYYATASKDKNKSWTEAKEGDGAALVKEMLDPINNIFLSTVKSNRGEKIGANVLTGKTYLASAATENGLIDGIKSFDSIVSESGQFKPLSQSLTTLKNNKMTASEFKNAHPEQHTLIVKEGTTAERERVVATLTYGAVDMETAIARVKNGDVVDEAFRAEMWQKNISQNALSGLKEGNKTVQTDAVETTPAVDAATNAFFDNAKKLREKNRN